MSSTSDAVATVKRGAPADGRVPSRIAQIVERIARGGAVPADVPSNDTAEGSPCDAQERGDRGAIRPFCVVGDVSLHGEGETASRLRPRDVVCIGNNGCGKSYLAAALAQAACRRGHSALFTRVQRLLQELSVARADGSYTKQLARLDELQVLVLDDFLLAPLKDPERRDLLEILEDRYDRSSTVIMSQLPTVKWHAALSDPTVHNAHVLPLDGRSGRKTKRRNAKAKP